MKLGEAIRRRRVAIRKRDGSRMTQADLAGEIGINASNISRIEAGEQLPTLDTLTKICAILGRRVSDVMREAEGLPPAIDQTDPALDSSSPQLGFLIQNLVNMESAGTLNPESSERLLAFISSVVPTDPGTHHGKAISDKIKREKHSHADPPTG